MPTTIRGIHPRLIARAPAPRPSLAILSGLRACGDDFAWAVWYAVWRVRGGEEAPGGGGAGDAERFRAAAEAVPAMGDEILLLGRYLQGGVEAREAADALLRISEWALESGHGEPAMQCAEAAAALVPDSARRALAAGRANRIFGEVSRAEMFYERAVALARPKRKWRTYVRAHLGLGQVRKALGDSATARAHFYTAARAARSLSGEKWLAAQTRHDLMALAAEEGACDDVLRHGRQALEWYPRHHPSLPALAHDFAFLLVRMDEYTSAMPLLDEVLPKLIPRDQVIAWSTMARAAAGVGDRSGYQQARENALRLVGLFDLHGAEAFDNLAWAACSLALWEDAVQYATRSLEIAGQWEQSQTKRNALRALSCAHAQRVSPRRSAPAKDLSDSLHELAADIGRALTLWRGATWRRKRQFGRERLGSV